MVQQLSNKKTEIGLVLQGGGALGAYEWGAVTALLDLMDRMEAEGRPVVLKVVAGVSIGAINGACVVGSRDRADARRRLAGLWTDLRLNTPSFLPQPVSRDIALFGLPHFYVPRADIWTFPTWTYVYEMTMLRQTLERHVDFAALNASDTRYVVTAVDVESGILTRFRNCGIVRMEGRPPTRQAERHEKVAIGPRHIMASASLAPAFAWTEIDRHRYWDGGLVDNTPLSDAFDAFSDDPEVDRLLVVMNMYPLRAPLPRNLAEVQDRVHELGFGNRLRRDTDSAHQTNDLVETIEALAAVVPEEAFSPDLRARVAHALRFKVIRTVDIDVQDRGDAPTAGAQDSADNQEGLRDFSAQTVERRRQYGYDLATKELTPLLLGPHPELAVPGRARARRRAEARVRGAAAHDDRERE
jgi:NTE family protein